MEKNFEESIESLKDLYQKKSKEEKSSDRITDNDFFIQFDHINDDFIFPAVESVNKQFHGLGYNLEIVPSPDTYADIRKAVQIILTSEEKNIDFLTDPYVLVEGYPKTGSIRIATSGSTDHGVLRPANEINRTMIEDSIYNLLKSAV